MEEQWKRMQEAWEQIYRNGGPIDVEVPDGILLNEIRSRMEGMCRHPDERKDLPEKVDDRYMARGREILCQAEIILQACGRWAEQAADSPIKKELELQSPYLRKQLEAAVKEKDLPAVRRLTEILEGQMEAERRGLRQICEKEWRKRKRRADADKIDGQMSIYDLIIVRRKQESGY